MARSKKRKKKAPSGTWFEREMFTSRAYLELTGFASQLLVLFLAKRDIDKERKVRNKNSITMTYIELENFYQRREANLKGSRQYEKSNLPKGISRPRITRAIEKLLAHGFIKIVHRGGAYHQDKTIYALTDDWRLWRPGMVIRKREPDTRKRGYNSKKKTNLAHETVPIHAHETVPIGNPNRAI